jgi:hypothetical protein
VSLGLVLRLRSLEPLGAHSLYFSLAANVSTQVKTRRVLGLLQASSCDLAHTCTVRFNGERKGRAEALHLSKTRRRAELLQGLSERSELCPGYARQ